MSREYYPPTTTDVSQQEVVVAPELESPPIDASDGTALRGVASVIRYVREKRVDRLLEKASDSERAAEVMQNTAEMQSEFFVQHDEATPYTENHSPKPDRPATTLHATSLRPTTKTELKHGLTMDRARRRNDRRIGSQSILHKPPSRKLQPLTTEATLLPPETPRPDDLDVDISDRPVSASERRVFKKGARRNAHTRKKMGKQWAAIEGNASDSTLRTGGWRIALKQRRADRLMKRVEKLEDKLDQD